MLNQSTNIVSDRRPLISKQRDFKVINHNKYIKYKEIFAFIATCSLTVSANAHQVRSGPEHVSENFAKKIDLAGINELLYGKNAALDAASKAFTSVFNPYYLNANQASQAGILQRQYFICRENLSDPTNTSPQLSFPFLLINEANNQQSAIIWHRYICSLNIHYTDELGKSVDFTSPEYQINQLDIHYGSVNVEPAVAFQNYNLGQPNAPSYPWMGRYVQPLNLLLRDTQDAMPNQVIAGVNGGYDYRVDAWQSAVPNDNICPPRWLKSEDFHEFYEHPAPKQCVMTANDLPSCVVKDHLIIQDDLGDSLVYLTPTQSAKSWRQTSFQSYNCGGNREATPRGAVVFYPNDIYTQRTHPSKYNTTELSHNHQNALSALGAGPLLIQDGHFVYDQDISEELMPIDNYEVGGQTAVGYQHNADGTLTMHIVNVDGDDNTAGMHDWMTGLYMLSPYAQSEGAVSLGNGGDATLWINPNTPAVQAILTDPSHPNYAYFSALFKHSSNPGIVSNCSQYTSGTTQCRARPVHDGLFLYSK